MAKTYELSPAQTAGIVALWDFSRGQSVRLGELAKVVFTPEVMADATAYKVCREKLTLHGATVDGLSLESARTKVYRMLAYAGIDAPGKNAGAANGKASATDAKAKEVEAIVAQGFKASIKAIEAALAAKDYSKARKIIDAMQAADKAAGKAVETTEPAADTQAAA